jgi:NAD(P)-dependent dehydrogenase (short-subunit alcohol dehydrogenase family)
MARQLEGRVALVTGAGKGIGRSIALGLAAEGARVAVVARTRGDVERVVQDIERAGGAGLALTADVADPGQVAASVAAVRERWGAVDILVNNAGHNTLGRIAELPVDDWWRQVEVSLRGSYLYCREVIPAMVERRWGRVINMSSVAGKVGLMFCTGYCSAKHAVIGLTRALALEVADKGVTVNAVCPGFVLTDLTDSTSAQRSKLTGLSVEEVKKRSIDTMPQKTAMGPDDLVPAVLFLASEGAARITGESLNVSSGRVMH